MTKRTLLISVVFCLSTSIAFYFWSSPELTEVKTLSTIALSDYYNPDGDSVKLYTKVPITDREAAIALGDMLFHKKTSISRVACSDCHNTKFGGRSFMNKEHGGGLFRQKYHNYYKEYKGKEPYIPIDGKPFKNITVLNSHRIHESQKLLHHGAPSDFPLEAQIDSATNAHFMQDLVLECRHDPFLQQLAMEAFDEGITTATVKSAISAFEQTLTTSKTNASQGNITQQKGFILFDAHCKNCHFNREVSKSLALNPIHENVVPQSLENVRQSAGYFQTSEDISLYAAIKRHRGVHVDEEVLTMRNIYAIKSFLNKDLFDARYSE